MYFKCEDRRDVLVELLPLFPCAYVLILVFLLESVRFRVTMVPPRVWLDIDPPQEILKGTVVGIFTPIEVPYQGSVQTVVV